MSTAPIARASLTKLLVEHMTTALTDTDLVVGRGRAPKGGGWPSGSPGKGTFVPYLTIKTASASTPKDPDPIGRSKMSWILNYVFTYSAVLDDFVDDQADIGRAAVCSFSGDPLTLRGVQWTVQQVSVPRLGSTQANESTSPAFWEVSDDVSLQLSRVRGQ